ncbi:unnamed protein product [Auanema sp. JU1783]|nr:unnamed protein product [Auanema sp. JU1783]
MRVVLSVFCFILVVSCEDEWTPDTYPNPRSGGFRQCSMRSVSNICDPNQILNESDRYRLNNELSRLSTRSSSDSKDFCARKGIDAVLAIVPEGSQKFADELSKRWNLDGQCQKSAVFVFSSDERHLYYGGEKNTGINPAEFDAIAFAAKSQLSAGHYVAGLVNIFKELGKKTNPVMEVPSPSTPRGSSSSSSVLTTLLAFVIFFIWN